MKLAFVFPGQGAQAVGMGKDLYENSAAARAVFDAVDTACGTAVSTLCFDGPEEALRETRNTQPCLFAVSVAALAACRELGWEPSACAGHSVGEYAALVAAGALDVATGAQLVQLRGQAMADAAEAHPGTMAAVLGLDAEPVRSACEEAAAQGLVVVANYNSPGQIVISGTAEGIAAAGELLKARGAKRVKELEVSGAFHSPLMEPAVAVLRTALASATITPPQHPIVANVTADYVTTPDAIRENLAAQVAGSVRWIESIERLVADGYTTFIECGSGKVLAGLIKRIVPDGVVYSVGDLASRELAKEGLGL